ncbi:MAG TPA: hypothetical protein VL131_10055 [Gammaproteobacteria bacterium]|nr:hypothetical protein [Gammaproteobacteria bacterium]
MARRNASLASSARLVCVLAALSLLASCSTRLISDYDEATDHALTSIQQKTDDFVIGLEKVAGTPDAAFQKHAAFYDDVDHDLRQLEFRVGSIPNNSHTQTLVEDIRAAILGDGTCKADGTGKSLRDLHCSSDAARGPSAAALEINRRNLNQTISAALQLELAKKQGLERNQ